MEHLTKELLLQNARHPDQRVKKAYMQRLFKELLIKRMVLIEDIDFSLFTPLDMVSFFYGLTEKVLEYDDTSSVWNTYFEIISKAPVSRLYPASQVLNICQSDVCDELKEQAYKWLRNLSCLKYDEEKLICNLLTCKPFNEEFGKIALERFKYLQQSSSVFYSIRDLSDEQTELKLNLFEKLLKRSDERFHNKISEYLLKKEIPRLYAKKGVPFKEYLNRAISLLVLSVERLKDVGNKGGILSAGIYDIYRNKIIDTDLFLYLYSQLINSFDEDKNNSYQVEISQNLVKVSKGASDKIDVIVDIYEQILNNLTDNMLLHQIMHNLTIIVHNYQKLPDAKNNIVQRIADLFLSKVSVFKESKTCIYFVCLKMWDKIDEDVYFQTAINAPVFDVADVIQDIVYHHHDLRDNFFQSLILSEENVFYILNKLIHIVNVGSKEHSDFACKQLEAFIEKYNFSEKEVEILNETLSDFEKLKHLQVKIPYLEEDEINKLLALLEE